jgi:hypothetical protein
VARGYGRDGLGRFLAERKGRFDVVLVSRPHNMAAFRDVAGKSVPRGTPVIYDAEAIFATREALRREILGEPWPQEQLKRQIDEEMALTHGARTIIAVNAEDAQLFSANGHPNVRVLRYAVVPRPTSAGFDQRRGFLFVGPTYADGTPNADAVTWFADHILPRVQHGRGRNVSFTIAGIQRSPAVTQRLNGETHSLGALDDLTSAYDGARVFVAPIRFASGIPIKVYDAAAHGVPVVLTQLLANQLGWQHEREALVAASADDFATQCNRLHDDRSLWEHVRSCALRRIEQDCDPPGFNRAVADILDEACRGGRN